MAAGISLKSVGFEVFGKVQGVFFRKYTQKKALKLGLKGFVKNTPRGTVVGVIQGTTESLIHMKEWLEKIGSPQAKIEKCVFKDEVEIQEFGYSSFDILRKKSTKS